MEELNLFEHYCKTHLNHKKQKYFQHVSLHMSKTQIDIYKDRFYVNDITHMLWQTWNYSYSLGEKGLK